MATDTPDTPSRRYIQELLAQKEQRVRELENQRTDLVRQLAEARSPRARQVELLRWRLSEEMAKRHEVEGRLHRIVGRSLKDLVLSARRHFTGKTAEEDGD